MRNKKIIELGEKKHNGSISKKLSEKSNHLISKYSHTVLRDILKLFLSTSCISINYYLLAKSDGSEIICQESFKNFDRFLIEPYRFVVRKSRNFVI